MADETEQMTRRQKAFARYKKLYPNYHGGFLQDCFVDDVCDALNYSSSWYIYQLDPNSELWDRCFPEGTKPRH